MSQNQFAKLLLITLLHVGFAVLGSTAHAAPPNVLLIVADDQGYPDLGCIASKPVRTPHLDAIARDGIRATNFYVTWPACTPSRGSILTGRYPQRNGLYDMIRNDMVNYQHQFSIDEYAVSPEMTLGLDVREKTIGDYLQAAGYRTGVFGKWDMGQAKRFLPLQRGFHRFYGHGNNGIDYYTHERYGIASMFRDNQPTVEDRGTYATDLFERETLAFIRDSSKQPWFVYLPFNAPHSASSFAKPGVQVPENYAQEYLKAGVNEKLANYFGAVTRMDETIGSVLQLIEELGQTDHTLVMFLSDNGGSGNGGNAPLKGAKSTMWEGGLRVPFLAKWPKHIPANQVTDEFLSSLELLPTIAGAANIKLPNDVVFDGFDMMPVLRGDQLTSRTSLFWKRRTDVAARIGHWKWVDSKKGSGLYDLSNDVGETRDLSQSHPEKLEELKAGFADWLETMETAEPRGPFRNY